jgi:hypothetical protein
VDSSGNNSGSGGQASTNGSKLSSVEWKRCSCPGGGGSSAGTTANGNNASERITVLHLWRRYWWNTWEIIIMVNLVFTWRWWWWKRRFREKEPLGSGAPGQVIISWCTPPTITSQPANQTITYGSDASFSVSSSTSGVTYQWQVSTDNGQNWQNFR